MKTLMAAIITATMMLGAVQAADFETRNAAFKKGLAAHDRGDYSMALRVWKPLAEQGYPTAQSNIGSMYDKGRGVTQNFTEALKWYHKAAAQGYAGAQFNIGRLYEKGQGVAQDFTEAVKWFRRSAEQGYTAAQAPLGLIYALGRGVIQDNVTGQMWLNIASARGDELGRKGRNAIAKMLTPAESAEAQRRARVCVDSKYKNCK
jgi:uncharacterized protein